MFTGKTYKTALILSLILAGALIDGSAQAQSVTETRGISFGTFALANNNAAHTLSFTWTESVTADPAYIVILPPQRGEYAISGFPALSPLSVTINNATLTKDGMGGGELFSITNYDRNAITTDGSGNATLFVGGDLETSGSTSMYTDGNYSDVIDITVEFP